ncbi:transcription factor that binds to CRE motif [Diplodia seriata]|uniref:Transcription factor that binds to CRE motif n=1 Tax=Diplodia seriata TaxID=420778 RepID=A0ABR3CWH4_9PEZI
MDAEQSSYTFSNPAITATPLDFSMLTPPASDIPTTIKMEDLHSASSPQAVPEAAAAAPATPSASTSSNTHKSQPKKRKSWGQVLPEPKTNLPPRKRAKTADEKEQRRIERVKRNRLAAHNSRERKREEMERLTAERDHWKNSLDRFFTYTKQLEDQISWYRSRTTEQLPILPRIIDGIEMPPATMFSPAPSPSPAPTSAPTNTAPTSTPATVTTSADKMKMEREGSVASTTINPREASFTSPAMKAESSFGSPAMNNSSYASPESMEDYDSPINSSSQPPTPRNDDLSFVEPDQTQHSAAMFFQYDDSGKPVDFSLGDYLSDHPQPSSFVDDASQLFDMSAYAADHPEGSFFDASFPSDPVGSFGFFEHSGAKSYDLHADSGATVSVSDGPGTAA